MQTKQLIEIENPIRLRVRRIDENELMQRAIKTAIDEKRTVIIAKHGGDVNNSYKYPADTEGAVVVAKEDGSAWIRVVRLPANKVSLAGVFAKVAGWRGLFDARFSDAKKKEARAAFLSAIESKF